MKSEKEIIEQIKLLHDHYTNEENIGKNGFGAEEQEFEAGQMVGLAWVLGISAKDVLDKYFVEKEKKTG